MYERQITQLYQNLLGRAPDASGLAGWVGAAQGGMGLDAIRGAIYASPEATQYRNKVAQEQQNVNLVRGFENQISELQSGFQQQLQQQAAQFAEAQRKEQMRIEQLQQQALESQTRQAAPQQTAQLATGAGSLKVLGPGASTRFSRPELQIKSMNI